ncbi:DUF599 domain-containing protein [Sulfitobacter sp. LCG007]
MSLMDQFDLFSMLDLAALAVLVAAWIGIGWRVENPRSGRPSVSVIMAGYRLEWMREMVTRDPRIFDAQILANLRQGTAFFASTSVIAIGGVLALVGNPERLAGVAQDIAAVENPAIVWEVKLLVLALFLTNSFLCFAWSNRLFGYCSVLMASVPNEPDHPQAYRRAEQAGRINVTAAKNFNRGLRSVYFSLAAATWLAGPIALMIASGLAVIVIWRREFASQSRKILIGD